MKKIGSDNTLGPDFSRPIAGRGIATADYDNDGDIDIVTNNRGDYPELLCNDGGNQNHWLEVSADWHLRSNRDGIGASLKLLLTLRRVRARRAIQRRHELYVGESDPRIFFGLGKRTENRVFEITWPSGQVGQTDESSGSIESSSCKGRHWDCAAVVSQNSAKVGEPMKNPLRRRFLSGSSSVLLGGACYWMR